MFKYLSKFALAAFAVSAMVVPSYAWAQNGDMSTLDLVQTRGTLQCGISLGIPGFSQALGSPDAEGYHEEAEGFDVDFCKALGKALEVQVRYLPTSSPERFAALRDGLVDVLSRVTTYTFRRDTVELLNFMPTTFYDGQGFMSKDMAASADVPAALLGGATVCVDVGTTTLDNLEDFLTGLGVPLSQRQTYPSFDDSLAAYSGGSCTFITTDKSILSVEAVAGDFIATTTISEEPLGPVVREGDEQWSNIVRWVVYALMIAEENGVDSTNVVAESASPSNPEIGRLLGNPAFDVDAGGVMKSLGEILGLDREWAFRMIGEIGNYAEIYDTHLEPTIPRAGTENNIPANGGLLFTPPAS